MGLHVITVEVQSGTEAVLEETKKFVGSLRKLGIVAMKATVRHCDSDYDVSKTWVSPATTDLSDAGRGR